MDKAEKERAEGEAFKAEYDKKMAEADSEAEIILSESRKKALKHQDEVIASAKEEAGRIMARAQQEAELDLARLLLHEEVGVAAPALERREDRVDQQSDRGEAQHRRLPDIGREYGQARAAEGHHVQQLAEDVGPWPERRAYDQKDREAGQYISPEAVETAQGLFQV